MSELEASKTFAGRECHRAAQRPAQAAGKLGIPVIGLTCGGWKRDDLRDAGCVEVWQDPADLLLHFDQAALGR